MLRNWHANAWKKIVKNKKEYDSVFFKKLVTHLSTNNKGDNGDKYAKIKKNYIGTVSSVGYSKDKNKANNSSS